MKAGIFLFGMVFLSLVSSGSKINYSFDRLLMMTSQNPKLAENQVQKLLSKGLSENQKVELHLILSEIYNLDNRQNQSLQELKLANQINQDEKSDFHTAYILNRLSEKCSVYGLENQSKLFLEDSRNLSDLVYDPIQKSILTYYHYEILGKDLISKGIYKSAIDSLEKSRLLLQKKSAPLFFKIKTQNLLGEAYRLMGDLQNSKRYYTISLADIENGGEPFPCEMKKSLMGISLIYLKQNKITEMGEILKGLNSTDFCNYQLELEFQEILKKYFEIIQDEKNSSEVDQKIQGLMLHNIEEKRETRNELLSFIESVENDTPKNEGYLIKGFIGLFVLLLIGGVLYYIYYQRVKRDYRHFEELLNKVKAKTAKEKSALAAQEKVENKSGIPLGTVELILTGLQKFEDKNQFINPDLTIDKLAKKVNSNSKYVSEVINKYKNQNYNTYINELRVNYIINKMQNEPDLLKYKVAYLAEISGFSSHSAFSTVFKSITQLTPQQFISFLRKKQNTNSQ